MSILPLKIFKPTQHAISIGNFYLHLTTICLVIKLKRKHLKNSQFWYIYRFLTSLIFKIHGTQGPVIAKNIETCVILIRIDDHHAWSTALKIWLVAIYNNVHLGFYSSSLVFKNTFSPAATELYLVLRY